MDWPGTLLCVISSQNLLLFCYTIVHTAQPMMRLFSAYKMLYPVGRCSGGKTEA